LLLPLSFLYKFIILWRRYLYEYGLFKTTKFTVPVIIVGNITVGGVGKTPLVLWLINFLVENGFKPGVVSRGYGGKQNKTPFIVTNANSAFDVGDEALMIVQRTSCPMVIAKNRVAAVQKLLAAFNCNIVISDDGLQHYALARDLEIVVIDGERMFGNGYCLPAGPLREPRSRLKNVEFIVTNSNNKNELNYTMQLTPKGFYNVKNPKLQIDIQELINKQIHAIAGIGNPSRFFDSLKKMGLSIIEHSFPDHYFFSADDFKFSKNAIVLMTEKDAVKCGKFASDNWWYLQINAQLDNVFVDNITSRLNNFLNQRDS